MGESKRRRQALGDRYGNTPPVLMPESEQLEEHAKKFTDAFLAKFKENSRELLAAFFEANEETLDQQQAAHNAQTSTDMNDWLTSYLEPYRPKDRETLALHVLAPMHLDMCLDEQDTAQDEVQITHHFMMKLTMCLFCFHSLKHFLSESNQAVYRQILGDIYSAIQTELKDDPSIKSEERIRELKSLGKLFRPILENETALV